MAAITWRVIESGCGWAPRRYNKSLAGRDRSLDFPAVRGDPLDTFRAWAGK